MSKLLDNTSGVGHITIEPGFVRIWIELNGKPHSVALVAIDGVIVMSMDDMIQIRCKHVYYLSLEQTVETWEYTGDIIVAQRGVLSFAEIVQSDDFPQLPYHD